jgi:hypothetical protein
MIKAASAGEMMPDSDQVVCIVPLARGNRLSGTSAPNWSNWVSEKSEES